MPDLNVRIKSKHDTTANWNNAQGFIPLAGEVIIYDDYDRITTEENGITLVKEIPAIKIGDGSAYVQDLPFVGDDVRTSILSHIGDTEVHVSTVEKTFWSNKINIDDAYDVIHAELDDETLVFNRN